MHRFIHPRRSAIVLLAGCVAVAVAGGVSYAAMGRAGVAGHRPVASSRQQLLQTLGVLRTSSTATDRALRTCIEQTANRFGVFKCYREIPAYPETIQITEHPAPVARSFISSSGNPKWDLTLIRSVQLGRPGESVTFFPGNWRPSTDVHGFLSSPPSARRTWGVVAAFVPHRHDEVDSSPTSVGTLRAHGLVLFPYAGPSKTIRVAIIVPDGVARITVGMLRLGGQHWLENVTAGVRDNVATVQLKTPGSRFDGLQSAVARVTWFGARGEVIRRTTTAMQE